MRAKSILLVIGGGIAAYKSLELIRRLKERGISVRTILTRSGAEFVTPLSIAALSNEKVHHNLFSLVDEAEMGHIQLSRSADLVVVAPATADLLAKMAHGLADDLASTALLATAKPILVAPAMNVRMWTHPSTRRNVDRLRADSVGFVGPDDGEMACGEFGPGRMAAPEEILRAIEEALFLQDPALGGIRALVTAGPTHEPLDPVRFLANQSSGKQGYAIAEAFAAAGAETILVSGPVSLSPPNRVKLVRVRTAHEMMAACRAALPVDVAVFAAAVSDWRPAVAANRKIKKQPGLAPPQIALEANPDILAEISRDSQRPAYVVGFAAETDNVVEHARAKLAAKQCDLIVANDVSPESGVMGGAWNTVHLVSSGSVENWPRLEKSEVGKRLVARIAEHLRGTAA
ncbi:MAG: bifunctional phosphopantothenoylcysteine decarboxylase/phosphopantothenate--cysteine ligase CoaBC [Alphaproteobacteria bacterium]|nr:bifunctional phosphopantothenoylcysteine decarboxylase/phosphopantothenate--cysteine ligase CoaBC [Alphaproteobacteria bacterium]